MNDLMRYPFGTISKTFYSGLSFGLFKSFAPPPVFVSFRSLRSLCFICIKREGGGKDINKSRSTREVEDRLFVGISTRFALALLAN